MDLGSSYTVNHELSHTGWLRDNWYYMWSRSTVADDLNLLVRCEKGVENCISIGCLNIENISSSKSSLSFDDAGDLVRCVID